MTRARAHIAVIGVGAVGGYVGGYLALAGEDVTFVGQWPEHIEQIKTHGVHLSGTQGEHTVKVNALHICDVQRLIVKVVDIAIVCTKSFDTAWAVTLIKQYLSPSGYVVSMQNGINEHQLATVVGWGRTMGCVLNTIGVNVVAPGHVTRHRVPGGEKHVVFRIGEVHGRVTERATDLARRLGAVDSSTVTTNLWGERWSKLATNAMQMGILGATGLTSREIFEWDKSRNLMIRAAAEAIIVGRALGYDAEPILQIPLDHWILAASGDEKSTAVIDRGFAAYQSRQTEHGQRGQGSLGRDMLTGRRSEIDFINGLVASKGEEAGVPVPVHRGLTSIVRRIERREITPSRENILPLCA